MIFATAVWLACLAATLSEPELLTVRRGPVLIFIALALPPMWVLREYRRYKKAMKWQRDDEQDDEH